ncbi:DUF1489 family protein [Amaricoccus solimangrovi]|uniref:DUF1489 family protein n=1 Tax=Amaricoccus solimangrovi TaxID=2589815 RepID=A0A501WTS2_9RHOB|nr:DUF1489 domain-containing protein [Amaricoccus solimangrovi]TPE53133.1 DUF1489 family protein [Amaricoccus solimangrovi]
MSASLHLVKLCVGAAEVSDLVSWQAARMEEARAAGRTPLPSHVTRMWPRRAEELLDGGSLYWVFKGLILARQRILSLDPRTGADGIERCAITLDPVVTRTAPRPRRPFQGWRYLPAAEAPPDVAAAAEPELPAPLALELDQIGVV